MALSMAGKDLVAAQNMLNGEVFADEVFGFHVQQAMEKSLKAWIAYVGREYPPRPTTWRRCCPFLKRQGRMLLRSGTWSSIPLLPCSSGMKFCLMKDWIDKRP
jgi:hypothetical protein